MHNRNRGWTILGAVIASAAVILQFVLMMQNRVASVPETIIRFFSFFTILTNSLVALYFICRSWFPGSAMGRFFARYSVATALGVYILIVGAVYQVILRHVWEPEGLQMLVDEALHSVIPVYFILYWLFLLPPAKVAWTHVFTWLRYPLIYFAYILARGAVSGFYPYPFIHVKDIGLNAAMLNAAVILLVFAALSTIMIGIARFRSKG